MNLRDLANDLTKFVHDANPSMPITLVGAQYPEAEEFIRFNLLLGEPMPSRRHDIDNNIYIELCCYSKHGRHRTDGNIYRPWEMADFYAKLFHQERITVKNTCIQFLEARQIYLDLNSLGDFAQNIQQQSPRLNLHAIIIECRGTINQSKE